MCAATFKFILFCLFKLKARKKSTMTVNTGLSGTGCVLYNVLSLSQTMAVDTDACDLQDLAAVWSVGLLTFTS